MTSLIESFTNNLIVEDRYRMILDGLQVTLLITLCAAVLGTLLGGLVCWMNSLRFFLACSWAGLSLVSVVHDVITLAPQTRVAASTQFRIFFILFLIKGLYLFIYNNVIEFGYSPCC